MRPWTKRTGMLAWCLAAAAGWAPGFAQPQEGGEKSGEGDSKKEEAKAEAGKPEEKKEDTYFAVIGADVYTGTGEFLRGASILAKNGVIEEIGYDLNLPEKVEKLDAQGLRVYPGLVGINTMGLLGTAASEFEDTLDPFNFRMVLALGSGITTAVQGGAAVKLSRGEIKDALLGQNYMISLAYSTSNPSSKRSLVEKLDAASKYLREYRAWEEKKKSDKDAKEPAKKGVDTSIVSILEGKRLARFAAGDRRDLIEIAHLAQKYGFRPVIEGCREGWTVAEELGRAGAFAIVNPRERRNKSEELIRPGGSSIENAAILHKSGVQVAVTPGNPGIELSGMVGRDIMHLTVEASFAVRGGLSERAAIDAVTIVPARMLGLDSRIGTLEVGKDCDLIVTDGDLLHYESFVQYAVVSGKLAYDKEKELFFAHIRPRPAKDLAPEKRTDPGEEEAAAAKPAEEESKQESPPKDSKEEPPKAEEPPEKDPPK